MKLSAKKELVDYFNIFSNWFSCYGNYKPHCACNTEILKYSNQKFSLMSPAQDNPKCGGLWVHHTETRVTIQVEFLKM